MNLLILEAITAAKKLDGERTDFDRSQAAIKVRTEAENRTWATQVNYFRSVPLTEETLSFTDRARALFNHPRFARDPGAQEVFRAAVMKDPTKLFHRAVRQYLAKHKDGELAAFFLQRFLDLPPSLRHLNVNDNEVWVIKGALQAVASFSDHAATAADKENAQAYMREFCGVIVSRFPNMPGGFRTLVLTVAQRGVLHPPVEHESKLTSLKVDPKDPARETLESMLVAKMTGASDRQYPRRRA